MESGIKLTTKVNDFLTRNEMFNVKAAKKTSKALGSYLRPMYLKDSPNFRPIAGDFTNGRSSPDTRR